VQVWFIVALPVLPTNWPGTQVVLAAQAVLEFASSSQVLPPHATLAAVLPAQ
jgi:hypothetical protein